MSKRQTGVFPVRHDAGKGWWICQPHRATAWKAMLDGKLIGRYSEKREADLNLDAAKKRKAGPARRYGFGRQMEIPAWRA